MDDKRVSFNPSPFYEKYTDSLIFYARNERSYERRINQHLTIFFSMSDNSPAGCEVNGVTRLLESILESTANEFDPDAMAEICEKLCQPEVTDNESLPDLLDACGILSASKPGEVDGAHQKGDFS